MYGKEKKQLMTPTVINHAREKESLISTDKRVKNISAHNCPNSNYNLLQAGPA